jgi:two-component system, cell cycle response regulator
MSARVLVVDDILANVKLLEAKLTAEYFEVVTALDGPSALELIEAEKPDIVLLDVMMPGMDGFEVCKRIKSNPLTEHIPVVMVTALDQASDRVAGIEAGADDFLTKPVNDIALMARVKGLVRLKVMMDELRMREATGEAIGIDLLSGARPDEETAKGNLLVVEERRIGAQKINDTLCELYDITIRSTLDDCNLALEEHAFDLVIVNLSVEGFDGLRLCSQIRSTEKTRHLPVLVLVDDGDTERLVKALEIGVNDYVQRPLDRNELFARGKTQLRRKRYADRLRNNFHKTVELAISDPLTGLYNRRYMLSHLETLMTEGASTNKTVSYIIVDIDYFKLVNDTHGHDVGDDVLKQFGDRICTNIRGADLACRYGGEEFVIIMPDTDLSFAYMVAERLRLYVADRPFDVVGVNGDLDLTISIGVACSEGKGDTSAGLMRRADQALYRAKRDGRNRVVADAA